MHWACKRGHRNVVDFLLKHGAKPDLVDTQGRKPFDFLPMDVDQPEGPFVPSYIQFPSMTRDLISFSESNTARSSSSSINSLTRSFNQLGSNAQHHQFEDSNKRKSEALSPLKNDRKPSRADEDLMMVAREFLVYNADFDQNTLVGCVRVDVSETIEALLYKVQHELNVPVTGLIKKVVKTPNGSNMLVPIQKTQYAVRVCDYFEQSQFEIVIC